MISQKGLKELEERVKDCNGKEVMSDKVGIDYCCVIRVGLSDKIKPKCPYLGMVRVFRMVYASHYKEVMAHVCLYHKTELND